MQQLIKIETKTIGSNAVNSVDARELHAFLESKQEFAHWIKNRIEKYDLIQGIDFVQFDNFIKSNSKPRIDYALTIEAAKELSMVENNDRGKEARRYFIECEKTLRNIKWLTPMQILEQQLELMREQERQIQAVKQEQSLLANEIHEIKAKVTTTNSDFYSIAGYASLRGIRHLDILTAGKLGKLSTRLSKEYDMPIGSVKDERFGRVNTYHVDILNEAFATTGHHVKKG